jgi:D-alanyl-lipoteichoic acid acyltransferase DltB (MBOAT superfamily)
MDFNSLEFLLFLPIVVSVYFRLSRGKWLWLLLMSYYFYGCWRVKYLPLLIIVTLVNFLCAAGIAGTANERARKGFLAASVAASLGMLFTFKYYNFLGSVINGIYMGLDVPRVAPVLHVALPIGISFYTFQALGYTIDVFKKRIPAEKNLGIFSLFVSFFPQLVAGPIERAGALLPQFRRPRELDYDRCASGLTLVAWGLFKKMAIADRLAVYVDAVYNHSGDYTGLPLIAATYFFALQIYCDFSGYSDIAIGCARMMGYDLSRNFENPYFSSSIPEFWRKWHMTLMSWFKDYVYIPLGGNRKGEARKYANQFCVFFLSGLWHGANMTFVLWGAYHGVVQILVLATAPMRRRLLEPLKLPPALMRALGILITFNVVCFGWAMFRAENIRVFLHIARNLGTGAFAVSALLNPVGVEKFQMSVLLVAVLLVIEVIQVNPALVVRFKSAPVFVRYPTYCLLIIGILLFSVFEESPFLYFQF